MCSHSFFFFFVVRPPPISTLFPYTTLFRSAQLLVEPGPLGVEPVDLGGEGRDPVGEPVDVGGHRRPPEGLRGLVPAQPVDRKSTRLNSSHANISYAVFCLKKKNKQPTCQRM